MEEAPRTGFPPVNMLVLGGGVCFLAPQFPQQLLVQSLCTNCRVRHRAKPPPSDEQLPIEALGSFNRQKRAVPCLSWANRRRTNCTHCRGRGPNSKAFLNQKRDPHSEPPDLAKVRTPVTIKCPLGQATTRASHPPMIRRSRPTLLRCVSAGTPGRRGPRPDRPAHSAGSRAR